MQYDGHCGPVTSTSCHRAPSQQMDFSHLFLCSSFDWTIKLWSLKLTTEQQISVSGVEPSRGPFSPLGPLRMFLLGLACLLSGLKAVLSCHDEVNCASVCLPAMHAALHNAYIIPGVTLHPPCLVLHTHTHTHDACATCHLEQNQLSIVLF